MAKASNTSKHKLQHQNLYIILPIQLNRLEALIQIRYKKIRTTQRLRPYILV